MGRTAAIGVFCSSQRTSRWVGWGGRIGRQGVEGSIVLVEGHVVDTGGVKVEGFTVANDAVGLDGDWVARLDDFDREDGGARVW